MSCFNVQGRENIQFHMVFGKMEHKMQKKTLKVRWGHRFHKACSSFPGPEGGFPAFDNGESHHA